MQSTQHQGGRTEEPVAWRRSTLCNEGNSSSDDKAAGSDDKMTATVDEESVNRWRTPLHLLKRKVH